AKANSAKMSSGPSRGVEHVRDAAQHACRSTAVAFRQSQRSLAHSFTKRVVFDQPHPYSPELLSAFHLHPSLRRQKLCRHLLKVLHGLAKNRSAREPCRLENVVSAGGNE